MRKENGVGREAVEATVKTEVRGEILLVRLSRPHKRNALNDDTVLALENLFTTIPAGVKCAVIYGEGSHFSAGLDLSELTEKDIVQGIHHSRMWHRALDKIQFGTVPFYTAPVWAVVWNWQVPVTSV
jgi:(methylthio)acryloyl-CoA hydratase